MYQVGSEPRIEKQETRLNGIAVRDSGALRIPTSSFFNQRSAFDIKKEARDKIQEPR
jgi:hypothetical protein